MTTLFLLHGFAGAPESWDAVVARLRDATVVGPALTGHGAPLAADWDAEVARLGALLPDGAHVCGYSLGGRLALGLLAAYPHKIARATLIGAHSGIVDDAERAARLVADDR